MTHSKVPAALRDFELRDPAGLPVRLGDTWSQRPVALAFVRHFG